MDVESRASHALTSIGVSAGVITLVSLVAVVAFLYKNYLDIQKIKLQIVVLRQDMTIPSKAAEQAQNTAND